MLSRKLAALGFPQVSAFDCRDEVLFRNFIIWLEDQKLRTYKIEDRAELRDVASSTWNEAFVKYLSNIQCPYAATVDRHILVDWLLGFAVRLEYSDDVEKYKQCSAQQSAAKPAAVAASRSSSTENPLENLDFESEDFKAGVYKLAELLHISKHPDHLIVLKAVSKLIQERLSNTVVEQLEKEGYKKPEGEAFKLDQFPLGFKCDDHVVENAARALRLLHVHELRELQTKINETIVAVQAISADPKTDERLGQIGGRGGR